MTHDSLKLKDLTSVKEHIQRMKAELLANSPESSPNNEAIEEDPFGDEPAYAKDAEEDFFDKLKGKFRKKKNIEDVLNDPDFLDVKNDSIRKGIDKTVRIVNSRIVRKTTHLAKNVLNITEKIKSGSVVSTGAAAIASLELMADFFDIPKPDHFKDFIKESELKAKKRGNLVEMILSPKILLSLDQKVVYADEDCALVEIELGKDNFMYMKQADSKDHSDNPEKAQFFTKYYVKEEFDYEVAYKYFWECFDNKIYLTNKGVNGYSEQLRLQSLKFEIDNLLIDEVELNMIGSEINNCKEKGRSRSYLLVGPPGTGKSSFCFVASNKFCPRVLKVDPSVMHKMESGELEFFIEALRPDAIIFDDIDRCDTEGYLLFVLENLKKAFPELIVFATANDFESLGAAIIRPGRFDRVIWVENPDDAERLHFISHYAKSFNLLIPGELMQRVVEGTEGFSQAYLIEMLSRACDDADMETSFMGSIKEFRRTLRMDLDD